MPQEERVVELILKNNIMDLVFGTHNIYRLGEPHIMLISIRKLLILSEEGNIIEGMPANMIMIVGLG